MSTSRTTRRFRFNTVTTSLIAEGDTPGKFDRKYNNQQLAPFFEALSAVDGIVEFTVGRSFLDIETFDNIVGSKELKQTVDRIVADMADLVDDEGAWRLFPNRGDKIPKATLVSPAKPKPKKPEEPTPPSRTQYVSCKPGTHLTRYITKEGQVNDFDREAFDKRISAFAEAMTDLNGVLGFEAYMNNVHLKVDTDITSVDDTKAHMIKVFHEAVGNQEEMKDVLPYIGDIKDLQLDFTVSNA